MIELPTDAVPNGAEPALVDYGGFLRPGLGGRVQRIDRMGNRFKVAFSFPPFASVGLGRIVVSRLLRGKTEGIRIEMPLLGFKPGAPGSPVVDGAGQSGRSLLVRGFTPNYAIREGAWFTHVHANGRCLYNVDASVAADATGDAELSISPMLRVEPADGDVLEFGKPTIEGFVEGEEWRWRMSLEHHVHMEFEVEEFE